MNEADALLPAKPTPAGETGARAFLMEAMLAAGPRKAGADYDAERRCRELGEDAAGFAHVGDHWVFWLADGTSDSFSLPDSDFVQGLNARRLACDLGQAFCKAALTHVRQSQAKAFDLQGRVLDPLAQAWRAGMAEYVDAVVAQNRLDELLGHLPELPDGKRQMIFSSTLICGVFDERRGALEAWNLGDSGALVVASAIQVVEPASGRVFVVATLAPGADKPEVAIEAYGQAELAPMRFEGVTGFVAMSDGVVNRNLSAFLSALAQGAQRQSLAEIRRSLLRRADASHDDKSILFGRYLSEEA